MILIDTNILLRSKQKQSPHYQEVTSKLLEFIYRGEDLSVCPQIIYEFFVVATRPIENNGLGLALEAVLSEIQDIINLYAMPVENELVFDIWNKLIVDFKVLGKNAHDARIVAFMIANNIDQLYTLNKSDFLRYSSIIKLI